MRRRALPTILSRNSFTDIKFDHFFPPKIRLRREKFSISKFWQCHRVRRPKITIDNKFQIDRQKTRFFRPETNLSLYCSKQVLTTSNQECRRVGNSSSLDYYRFCQNTPIYCNFFAKLHSSIPNSRIHWFRISYSDSSYISALNALL